MMDQSICEYCGTEFSSDEPACPGCGLSPEHPAHRKEHSATVKPKKRGGARLSKKKHSDRIPTWIIISTCAVLLVAVLAGAMFVLSSLGLRTAPAGESDQNLMLPIEDDTPPDTGTPVEPKYPEEPAKPIEPEEIVCTAITLNRHDVTFSSAGERFKFSTEVEPENCTEEVRYESSDQTVATVSADGTVTANNSGTATITASCGEYADQCIIRCKFDPVMRREDGSGGNGVMQLSSTDFTLFEKGETTLLSVKNAPSGADISWSTSDASVVTVSGGTVMAIGNGVATITADINGTRLSCIARCRLLEDGTTAAINSSSTPEGATVGTYVISHSDVTLRSTGESFRISLSNSDGMPISSNWTSSDTSVCSVSGGVVTAVGAGTAYVSAVFGGVTYRCTIRCNF